MKTPKAMPGNATAPAPRPMPRYEPPRILAKRAVERVTLFTETIEPGQPIGNP